MLPFVRLEAKAVPLPLANIDTDQIIPKQYLTTVEREGLGQGLFHDFRFDEAGGERPDFVLNRPEYRGSKILIAGDNFGCGSSREHAPWALMDFGIRCVIATSFADIFYNNCFQNGLLPVTLPSDAVAALIEEATDAANIVTVDLESQTVMAPSGNRFFFEIEAERKNKMLGGIDSIAETLESCAAIDGYERIRASARPWLSGGWPLAGRSS